MKAVLLLVLACLAVSCYATLSDSELSKLFVHWSQKHGKTYSNADFQARFEIFKANAHFVHKHNSANHSFTVALNKFADLNSKEFASIYNGLKVKSIPAPAPLLDLVVPQLPASVDWRTKGAVTPIKNQGQCGSCWSFSTTGSTEGAHLLQARKPLVGLSEQNLVDCSQSYGNQGCNGGLMDDAFKYIIANHGIDTEKSYPYTAETGTSCHFNPANVGATLVSYKDVASESEPALQEAIATRGPISVAIDAGLQSFQLYSGGVYYDAECSPTSLDHGVLAVGYGVSGSRDYYIVKNSWGSDWGLNGYIWMSRNRNNNCGIATMSSFPCATAQCLPQ